MDVVFASEANAVHLLICVSIEMQNFNIICCVLVIAKKHMRESLYLFAFLVRGEVLRLNVGA